MNLHNRSFSRTLLAAMLLALPCVVPATAHNTLPNEKPSDCRKATQRIYYAPNQSTFIELPTVTTP